VCCSCISSTNQPCVRPSTNNIQNNKHKQNKPQNNTKQPNYFLVLPVAHTLRCGWPGCNRTMEIATFTALAATSTLVCRTRRAARHGGGPSTTDTADGASGADSVHTPTPRERVTAGPYTASQSILILGDGDFTFSAALVGAFIDQGCPDACERIIATSYDTLADLHARYPRVVPETLAVLKAHNVRTLHGVDATNLHATLPHDLDGVRFDRVVFNFPHHSGKGLIQVNRALLSGTLVSCQDILKPAAEGGELHIPLAPGQGGTPIDEPRKFGNHWHVVQAAGNAGLDLVAVTPYDFTPFKGYSVTGRRGAQMTFRSHGSLLHVFRLPAVPSPLPARLARLRALQEAGVWRTPTFRRALTHATPAFVQQRLSNDSRRILRSRSHPTSRCMAVLERSARGVLPDARCFVSRDRATVVQAASLPRTFGTQHRFHSCLFHTDAPGAPGASGAPSTQVLRPWLSEQLRQVWNRRHTPSSSTVAMVSGAVSRREAWIDRFSSPVQHECEMLVSADHMTVRVLATTRRPDLLSLVCGLCVLCARCVDRAWVRTGVRVGMRLMGLRLRAMTGVERTGET